MTIGIDGNEANLENRVGINQYAAELLVALEKLPDAKRHEFIIYLKDKALPHLPKERKGWNYKILPGGGLWILRLLTPYLWLTQKKPDVFFTPSHYAPPFLPMPLVISIMDLGYLSSQEQFKKYDFYQLKYWGAWSLKLAKKIIAISQSTKKEIENYYPFSKGKIEVTLLGYNKKVFHFPISYLLINKVKKKYLIKSDYILFLSTLKPNKNVEGIVEAFSLLNQKNLQLVIAGKKGWLYDSIFKKVQELNLEDKVIFTDFIPEEEKPGLIAGARVFVAPSFWEGFGINVLEAMACGVPVVVSDVASLPEVVGDAGMIVNPHNTGDIARGISEALQTHDKLVKKVLEQARKFDWAKTAKQTLAAIESVVDVGTSR